jgi:hypothetical protein
MADRSSRTQKRFRFKYLAQTKPRSTNIGTFSPAMADKKANVVG